MVNDVLVNKKVMILALPEYVVTALNDRGVSEIKIAEAADFCMDIFYRKERTDCYDSCDGGVLTKPLDDLFSTLSKQDQGDISFVNNIMRDEFGLISNVIYSPVSYRNTQSNTDVISVLSDPKSDIARIVMSNLYSNVYVPWRFIRGSSSVIIVLEKGFFNYKVESIGQFDVYFLNILTSYMFNSFGFDRTINQEFFTMFNKRVHNLVSTR